jgi:hypothetical protein
MDEIDDLVAIGDLVAIADFEERLAATLLERAERAQTLIDKARIASVEAEAAAASARKTAEEARAWLNRRKEKVR